MLEITLHELQCLDAVVSEGSFQRAAARLHRTHPSVHSAVKNLETRLGVPLLDRSGYRSALTVAGVALLRRARAVLGEAERLVAHAGHLARGDEPALSVILGDLCPLPLTLGLFRRFFAEHPDTRLDLEYEALSGPWERVLAGQADLAVHHVDLTDARFESLPFCAVELVPVVAPGFLPFAISRAIEPRQMASVTQCIIRDSASPGFPRRDYFVLAGGHRCTVPDQLTKKAIIIGGMGWGRLPRFLITDELADGRLLSIAGRYIRPNTVELRFVRRSDAVPGPVAERLWSELGRSRRPRHRLAAAHVSQGQRAKKKR